MFIFQMIGFIGRKYVHINKRLFSHRNMWVLTLVHWNWCKKAWTRFDDHSRMMTNFRNINLDRLPWIFAIYDIRYLIAIGQGFMVFDVWKFLGKHGTLKCHEKPWNTESPNWYRDCLQSFMKVESECSERTMNNFLKCFFLLKWSTIQRSSIYTVPRCFSFETECSYHMSSSRRMEFMNCLLP